MPPRRTSARPDHDLALESLVEVLDRKRTVHFHSHRADDIMTVVRLAEEFGFEVVLAARHRGLKVASELARRKIPVSLTIPDSPGGKPEVDDLIEQNAALLEKAGVRSRSTPTTSSPSHGSCFGPRAWRCAAGSRRRRRFGH